MKVQAWLEKVSGSPRVGGGGLLSIFVRREYAVFQGIVYALFICSKVSKEGSFSGAGCQNSSRGEILLNRAVIRSNFCDLVYAFDRLFLESGII